MSYGQNVQFGYPEGVSIIDVAPDYMKGIIHEHWANYPPVNPMWHYLLGTIYVFLGIFSFAGNGTVLYLWVKEKKIRSPSNLLITNLAVLDCLMLGTNFPFFTFNSLNGGKWMFAPFYCQVYAFCGFVTGIGALWSLVFITLDRYNVIVHGVSGKPLTFGKAGLMVIFIWAVAISFSLAPFLGWGNYIPEGIQTSCSTDYLSKDFNNRSYIVVGALWCYFIPLFLIVYAYFFIVKTVVAHEAVMAAQAKKMNVGSLRSGTEGESAEMRVAKVAIFNVTLWIICWTPYCFVTLQGAYFDQSGLTPLATSLPALLAKSCSTYNPMVYALAHPRYRAAMQEHVPICCVVEPEASPNQGGDNKSNATQADEK